MLNAVKRLFSRRPPSPTIQLETSHPVMRAEPAGSFLWLDAPDGAEELKRRTQRGEINKQEGDALRRWATDGYVVFRGLIEPALIDAALDDLDRFWRERTPISIDLLTTGERTTIDAADPSVRSAPYKANDLYLYSENVRKIFLNEKIVRFGELLFGDKVVGCNSLMFEYSSQQPAHVDHIYMTPTPARRLFASWVACEDIRPDAGPLELWAGSHRLAPYDFGETGYHFAPERDAEHTRYIAEAKERFPRHEFLAKKGDVLLWHAMLVHGGGPIRTPGATRKSMAFHYFSRECTGDAGLATFGDALYMTKGVAHGV
jgi:ectoine hydroxylase-related dioxygenase (phytanoyl-CoA dioxygenase family)